MNRAKYLLKNTGILTLSNFASKILVFFLVPLYTSVLTTDEVGLYDLTVSTISLLYPIVTMNIFDGVMRFSMESSRSKDEIITIAFHFLVFGWIIGGAILIIIHFLGLFPIIYGYELLIFVYFFFYVAHQLLVQTAKGLERVYDMGIAAVVGTVAMLSANIIFLLRFKIGLKGFFWANILAQAFPCVYLMIRLKIWDYIDVTSINITLRQEMLAYSVPLIATTIGWWVNSASDKYVVTFICGVAANGLLSVSYKIPSIINTLQGIFIQAWQISAIKEYGEKDTSLFYGKAFCIINVLICAACSGLILLTKPLAHILYQKDFYSAWEFVPFLIVSCVLNCASGFLGPILSAKKDSKSMARSAIYGSLANVIMNCLFVSLIGVQGATIATMMSSAVIFALRRHAVGNLIKINNFAIIIISWILVLLQAILEVYTSLWWMEIIIISTILVLNRRWMSEIFMLGRSLIERKE